MILWKFLNYCNKELKIKNVYNIIKKTKERKKNERKV